MRKTLIPDLGNASVGRVYRMGSKRAFQFTIFLGNFFEHYDTALFGFLSPFLAPLIFPQNDPITALIFTYAIIPISMVIRPIGALVFGYIGDVYGRGQALFISLVGMAILSGFIACMPPFQQIGVLAPVLFILARILQNFLAAGETMGGAVYLLDNAEGKDHDFLSSFYGASTIGGILLASFGVFLISHYNIVNPAWRFLYVCGFLTALFGCIIRKTNCDLPQNIEARMPIKNVFWNQKKALLAIILTSGFDSATYSVSVILMNGFIPLISTLTKAEVMKANTYLLFFDFCALPCFGYLAKKISREKLMLGAAICIILFAIPLFSSLKNASFLQMILVRLTLVTFGVAFCAPFHAWARTLIPAAHRYTIISFGYAIGNQLLGSPTAAISLFLYQKTGITSSIAWYWILLATTTTITLMYHNYTRKLNPQH